MSIGQKITDVMDFIATALNARNAPGPSDFQMWVAQDPVARANATLADYRIAVLGGDEDLAAYLASLLTTPPRAGAATEAQAGVTQFATLAEIQAAALATKAISPKQYAALQAAAAPFSVATSVSGNLSNFWQTFNLAASTRPERVTDGYIAPRTGVYLVTALVRLADNGTGPSNIGVAITVDGGIADGGQASWSNYPNKANSTNATPSNRFSADTTQIVTVNAGQKIGMQGFSDWIQQVASGGNLTVVPLGV